MSFNHIVNILLLMDKKFVLLINYALKPRHKYCIASRYFGCEIYTIHEIISGLTQMLRCDALLRVRSYVTFNFVESMRLVASCETKQ